VTRACSTVISEERFATVDARTDMFAVVEP
jgi:hypothetical protein